MRVEYYKGLNLEPTQSVRYGFNSSKQHKYFFLSDQKTLACSILCSQYVARKGVEMTKAMAIDKSLLEKFWMSQKLTSQVYQIGDNYMCGI